MSSRYLSLPGKKFFCCIYKTVYHFILKEEMLSSKLRTNLKSVIIFKEVEKMFVIKTQTIIHYTLEMILAIFFDYFFSSKRVNIFFIKSKFTFIKNMRRNSFIIQSKFLFPGSVMGVSQWPGSILRIVFTITQPDFLLFVKT